ncbi:MAG: hypothetical protein DRQ43_06215 [Gammaproteobacteria bacterium]|nr:MAG: hypothetical protein DRQ43_06215 [Gammaproteobacteria bacterium]
MSDEIVWDNATWDGSRIYQLKCSLKLTPKQRFEALEEFSETCNWLAGKSESSLASKKIEQLKCKE